MPKNNKFSLAQKVHCTFYSNAGINVYGGKFDFRFAELHSGFNFSRAVPMFRIFGQFQFQRSAFMNTIVRHEFWIFEQCRIHLDSQFFSVRRSWTISETHLFAHWYRLVDGNELFEDIFAKLSTILNNHFRRRMFRRVERMEDTDTVSVPGSPYRNPFRIQTVQYGTFQYSESYFIGDYYLKTLTVEVSDGVLYWNWVL